jgi:hypothetical protein
MYILNHCSAQTEFFQTGFTDAVFPVYLTKKPDLSLFLFFSLLSISLIFSVPSAFSQDNTDNNFQESLEEDPFTESGPDLGLEEDPLAETVPDLGLEEDPLTESGPDLGLEEDPLAETVPDLGMEEDPLAETSPDLGMEDDPLTETSPDLGMDEDPLAESGSDLDMDEDPLAEESSQIGQEETPNIDESEIQESEIQVAEQEEYQPKVTFSHEVKTLLGGTETKGLSVLEPLLSEIKELRFVSTYEQSVKVQTSPRMYNYFRLSVSFSQNYELNKKRIFDGFASLREIYSNYRAGNHQIRYGTQIFGLGKVDLDKVIDVLHMNNIMGLYTFDPDDSKDSIPSIRYNWFRGAHTATIYVSPIRQQTFGMRFTEFREGVEKKEKDEEESKASFLRDYFGLQYQWTGDVFDTRFGFFHWFDANPHIKLEYQGAADNESTSLQGTFEKMLGNYNEKETRTDFMTFELDAVWSDMVWKLESGLFKKRNLYSFEITEGKNIHLSTVSAPHFAMATSFESTFPYFYWLMIYSHRKSFDVPENSHIFLYENESVLVPHKRDVIRNQVSGVAVLKTPDNSLRITLLNYQTWPFVQKGFASLFTWEQYKQNMELELKFFRLKTEKQKMMKNEIETNQVFLTYTQKFTAN